MNKYQHSGKYVQKSKMKFPWLPFLCFLFLIAAAGVVLRKDARISPVTDIPQVSAEPTRREIPFSPDVYDAVLVKYLTAIEENWSAEQCQIEDISTRMQAENAAADAGYAMMDLDGDGAEELLVGSGIEIWDVYTTLSDGTPIHILTDDNDGSLCYLCKKSIFSVELLGEDKGYAEYYRLENSKMTYLERLTWENDRWTRNEKSVSAEAAEVVMLNYQKRKPTWTLFSDAPAELRPNDNVMKSYQTVMETYKTALLESWDLQQCEEHNISLMVSYFAERPDELCAFFLDLDNNGRQELMITDGTMIYDLYTLDDSNEPVHLITGWERNAYQFCEENIISNHGSNSAASSVFCYYRMENGEMVLIEAILFDAAADPENPWFYSLDGATAAESLTEQEATACMDSYRTMSILGTPILEIP